jgi:hypothetical protein
MDKKIIIGALALVIIIAAVFMVSAQPKGGGAPAAANGTGNPASTGAINATLAHVEDLHMGMDSRSLAELEGIIKSDADNYTRERAVCVYSDIAFRSSNPDRALSFLKDVAAGEQNTEVRTSAYENYNWLKNVSHIGPQTTMDVRVIGDIKPGNNITVVLVILSTRGSEIPADIGMQATSLKEQNVTVGGTTIVDANAGKGALTNLILEPSSRLRRVVPANLSVEVPYTVSISRAGQAFLKARVDMRYDLLDSDTVEKGIFLDVGPGSGNYTIMQ